MSRDLTRLLREVDDPLRDPDERLVAELYTELRRLAGLWMRDERADHTLQATALVSEAWVRLVGAEESIRWEGRSHFVAVAARTMRRILVDHARKRAAEKRGGEWAKVTLGAAESVPFEDPGRFVALDDALEELVDLDPRAAKIVEMRWFGGFTMDEVARHLGISRRTAQDDWSMARAWLHERLSD